MASNTLITCQDPPINHLQGSGYLFGYPIAHSLSPLLHRTIFGHLSLEWDYFLLPSTNIDQFLRLIRDPKCYGSGVTMPHKIAIISHLDDISQEARAVGAVNTIIRKDGKLIGTNTDIVGIRESFYQNVSNARATLHGKAGMVIGGGGAARSAVYALAKYLQCSAIYLVNRDPDEVSAIISWCRSQGYGDNLVHVSTVSQAEEFEAPASAVACVPNFPPATESEKLVRSIAEVFLRKPRKGAMLEMCYHPTPWTELGALAERAGWQVILGTEAMIYQGLEQARHWTGREVSELPVEKIKKAVAAELHRAKL